MASWKGKLSTGLAIAHERGERSFMKEGNGDGKKLISDEGGGTAPLQKKALALAFLKIKTIHAYK